MGIRVFAAVLPPELRKGETAVGVRLLPREIRERIRGIQNPRRRRESLWGYLLLRYTAEAVFGFSELPAVEYQAKGKPVFPEHPGAYFSISHSGEIVLCAAGDAPVGADVERIRPVRPSTLKRMSGEEAAPSVSEEKALQRFFEAWVLREAEGKRGGEGISGKLRDAAMPAGGFSRLYSDLKGYCAAVSSDSCDLPEHIEIPDPERLWK